MIRIMKPAQLGAMAVGMVLGAGLFVTPAIAAEKHTVNAFAAYEGKGKIYLTSENTGTFVGAIDGQLFVESKKGPRHVGRIICPAMVQINLKTGKQAGSGQCMIIAEDRTKIFGVWSCSGVHSIGCDGRLMLTGGTGRASGVTGSGPISIRTTSRGHVKVSSDKSSIAKFGKGILVLYNFTYENPSQ